MTEYNLFSYNLVDGVMSAEAFAFYSTTSAWEFISSHEQFLEAPLPMTYSHFLETSLIIKQFEFVATDTIANGGVVDSAAELALQKFANRYDYTLMEAIAPQAEDNVSFDEWVKALYIEKYFAYFAYEESNLSPSGFTFEDLSGDSVRLSMS
jgi:hypothetical protein